MSLSDQDREDLRHAKRLLENPSLAVKITDVIGTPLEKGFELLPAKWSDVGAPRRERRFEPRMDAQTRERKWAGWRDAVARTLTRRSR